MKSVKLTPLWMFILLLAILILSVIIGSKVSEGFAARTEYVETNVTGYANKVWPLVASSIHFDKTNGNVVLQTGAVADKIITRRGDETGTASSVIKLDTPLATTVDGVWTSWTVSRDKNQLFYMPWDKITFAHLVTDGVHKSGFCFDGANQTVGEYDWKSPGKTHTRVYLGPLDPGSDSVTPVAQFLKPIYAMKSSSMFYDISSGCLAIKTDPESFDAFDREGNIITMSDLKTVTEGPDKGKIDFSLGKYTLKSDTKFSPWILNIATGATAKDANDAVSEARKVLIAAKTANDAKPTDASTTAARAKANDDLSAKKKVLAALVTKSVLVMPYGVNTLIATFVTETGVVKLIDVKRFNESGLVIPPPTTPPDASLPPTTPPDASLQPPSADSAISEYYKWYWYWNKTGKTASDDYMLKTQIVPPVCPACPVANCPAAAVVSGSGSGSVSGSATPISDAVKVTGSVAEKTVGAAGDILKSLGSGATSVGLGTVDLAKGTVSGTADLAKGAASGTAGLARDVVGGTVGLARDVVGGTVGLAKDTVKGSVGLAKDAIGGTVNLARGKYSADEGQRAPRSGGSYSASSHGTMDPYTYNGQLQNKPSADFMPVTANFSAFSK